MARSKPWDSSSTPGSWFSTRSEPASAYTAGTQFLSCINPTDAPLVHFSLDKGSDERNTSVGRITPFGASWNISAEDLVPFKFEKTAEGYFKITPETPLKPGEFGFVPQGSIGFFAAGERVYSFGVD